MLWFRSTCCNILMLFWTILCGIVGMPIIFIRPPKGAISVMRFWGKGMMLLARWCCGIKIKVEGTIPTQNVIIASKHQSAWETIFYHIILKNPAFVLKRELNYIPIIGWYVLGIQAIAINRKAGRKALDKVIQQSLKKLDQGRQVVIFPEGTRVPHGEIKKYHSGVGGIYERANVPIIPVALNSGLCWGKNSWIKHAGTITIKFLDPIPAGLTRHEAMDVLEKRIEHAQKNLTP